MTYFSESRFDSYVEAAVADWDSLGGVAIEPAESAASADLVYRDVESEARWEYSPAAGFTHTTGSPDRGEILLFTPKLESFDETDRKALVSHETGHALGFEHQNGNHSVMDQGWGGGFRSDTPTELDVRIYRRVWGGSGSPADVDPSSQDGEEQMSEECTYSFWPWA